MMEEIKLFLDEAKEMMEKSLKHTGIEFSKIRAGKASPAMLDGIVIEYYGVPTPVNQAATINTSDARTLVIKPFEKKLIPEIERAIINANLGLNPQNDGEVIRIIIPALTEERRRDLVKQVKQEAEAGRVAIRNIRKEINEELRKLQKEGASEDDIKKAEEKVQQLTDSYTSKIEELLAAKEKEIMTV
jgi:ribosome recycling factor